MTRRILVVDDDRDMVTTLSDILELHGWETSKGYDGAEAVRLAAESHFDFVLTDVRMPRVDGLRALTEIKARSPSTRVILMTAFVGPDLLEKAQDDGALSILRKPVSAAELVAMAKSALRRSRSLLVVDDNEDNLRSLASALLENDVSAIAADTLDDAIRLVTQDGARVVFAQLRLDHLDSGVNMLAVHEINPAVLLILLSGRSNDIARRTGKTSAGMVHAAFTKPIPIDRLLAALEEVGPS